MEFYNNKTWNDRWIVEEVFKGTLGGFFVEAGAQAGKWGSCTYVLEKEFGWSGILVEPVENHFKRLVENRPNSKCINVCLAEETKTVDFIEYEGSGIIGYSGIPQHWGEKRVVNPETSPHKKMKKQAITLEKLLDDCHAPKIIDYLALDMERGESVVLNAFDFEKYTFKAISLEGGQGAFNTLVDNGYVRVGNPFCRFPYESHFIHKKWIEVKYKI